MAVSGLDRGGYRLRLLGSPNLGAVVTCRCCGVFMDAGANWYGETVVAPSTAEPSLCRRCQDARLVIASLDFPRAHA